MYSKNDEFICIRIITDRKIINIVNIFRMLNTDKVYIIKNCCIKLNGFDLLLECC